MEKQILLAVADDHDAFRLSLVSALENDSSLKVTLQAVNGKDLLEQLFKIEQIPDMVLLDLNMPEMNGFETTDAIREAFPDLGIIVLSMHYETRHVLKLIEKGIDAFFFKNIQLDELHTAIHQVKREGYYFHQDMLENMYRLAASEEGWVLPNKHPLDNIETEMLQMICKQYSMEEITRNLVLSAEAAQKIYRQLQQKTGYRNRAGLLLFAMRHGISGGLPT